MSKKEKRKRMVATAIAIVMVISTLLGMIAPAILNY